MDHRYIELDVCVINHDINLDLKKKKKFLYRTMYGEKSVDIINQNCGYFDLESTSCW